MKATFFKIGTGWLFSGLLLSLSALGQSVSQATEKIDKESVPGISISLPIEGKFVEKEWESQLKSYGRVAAVRGGVYKVQSANIPAVSSEPINFLSKVSTSRDKATLFAAADLGSGNFAQPGSREYSELENLLKSFASRTQVSNELALAEKDLSNAQKNHEKMVRQGEKLQRDIERNKKEKETLLRRIDENAKELTDLEKAIETNKMDQASATTELDNRKKAVDAVRTKIPK